MQTETADNRIEDAIMREFETDPNVSAAHIGVRAEDDTVVLTGQVSSVAERSAAVAAAERVCSVGAVADEIDVRQPHASLGSDAEIAGTVTRQLRSNPDVPDTVKADIENGSVTVRGSVELSDQREEVARRIDHIRGVYRVIDLLEVKPT